MPESKPLSPSSSQDYRDYLNRFALAGTGSPLSRGEFESSQAMVDSLLLREMEARLTPEEERKLIELQELLFEAPAADAETLQDFAPSLDPLLESGEGILDASPDGLEPPSRRPPGSRRGEAPGTSSLQGGVLPRAKDRRTLWRLERRGFKNR